MAPQSSLSSRSPDPMEPVLAQGLAALKQKDYAQAIAHLETVQQAKPTKPVLRRAQMGLVTAYEQHQQPEKAIALCQILQKSSSPQLKSWAGKALAHFAKTYPHLLVSPSASPSPLPPPSQESIPPVEPVPVEPVPVEPGEEVTGFVPFDAPPPRSPRLRTQKLSSPKRSPLPPPAATRSSPRPPSTPSALSTSVRPVSPAPTSPPVATSASPATAVESSPVGLAPENPEPFKSFQTAEPFVWRQAGRAQNWQPLKPINWGNFLPVEAITAIALGWLILTLVRAGLESLNYLLVQLPYLEPIQALYADPTQWVLGVLGVLLVLSPWLLDALLKWGYGMQPLGMATLATHSPETPRLIQRFCRQKKISLPTLRVIPSDAPWVMTYGCVPGTTRIVVSQGLLDQLQDDEIAALYAGQLGHLAHWDFILMSWIVLILQIPYTLYWKVAQAGDWLHNQAKRQTQQGLEYLFLVGVYGLAAISSLSYGIYWLLRWPALWFSRLRIELSDRVALSLTGNPNGLTRALLKSAIGITQDIQAQGQTSYFLEGFELLMPLSVRSALTLGSLYPQPAFTTALDWERLNPYRSWLSLNHSHPLLGDRLQRFARCANYWKLEPELEGLETLTPATLAQSSPGGLQNLRYWQPLLLQGAPFWGIPVGLAIGASLWLAGGLSLVLDWWRWSWLFGEKAILLGCVPMGFSIGTFIRINAFFPDIKPFNRRLQKGEQTDQDTPRLADLLTNPQALPLDSRPLHLPGQLLGRQGIGNWLGQDVLLQTETGLIKLHACSQLGVVGNLVPQATRPVDLIQQSVLVTGWFRRGATPWIDLETIRTSGGRTSRSHHPIWSTILACLAALGGSYVLLTFTG